MHARHFTGLNFERFDWVTAMDAGHQDRLRHLCPPQHTHKLRRTADFSDRIPAGGVPDPYCGDAGGFERALALAEAVGEGVFAEIAGLDA